MKQRNPLAVFFLSIITLGIYGIVWYVKTKNEMNRLGAKIPTAWLIIIPLVSIYWMWKYSEGVGQVTKGEMSAPIAFILLFLLGNIGMAVIQIDFNKFSGQADSQGLNGMAGVIPPQPPVAMPGADSTLVAEPTQTPPAPEPPKFPVV